MTIEEALTSHLTGYGPLSDLIGDRVEPGPLSQESALPAITYFRVSRQPTQHRSSRRINHSKARFQFDVWGGDYFETITTRNLLLDAMAEFVRTSEPRVDVSLLADDRDAFEAEPNRWRVIVDYFIWHTEG